jgi:signal transduction histidine kinase
MMRTRFSAKLHVAFATLLLITLALAWYFNDSVRWYEHDVQRIALANNVLQGYQNLSSLTFRELNQLADRVDRGEINDEQQESLRDRNLRMAVSRIRQAIAAEVALEQSVGDRLELEALVDIERVVEDIIRSSGAINLALAEGRLSDAGQELSRLRSPGVAGYFYNLVLTAIGEQRSDVLSADREVLDQARYITTVLPLVMTVLVVLTFLVVFKFSYNLKKSVGALHDGVRAFTGGNLGHRIPELKEREFMRLGEAFNTMARELADHRTNLHDANVTLEAKIEERTRALKAINKKLANVDVKRRKLLADISHEFRTPLTVIRGESEIALRGNSANVEDYHESFRRIMDQADHTTRLVDDLLFMARVDAGEPRLTLRSVNLPGMLEAVCNEFAVRAEQKGITINQDSDDPQAVVHGDADRLRQVFTILLDNALRYSNHGGSVEVGLERLDKEIRIAFTDHGIGLTDEAAEQAFERFYRGSNAEQHARGTGLGLPVAKAIVEAHGGRISLEGQPGTGAVATVWLPAESRLRVVA